MAGLKKLAVFFFSPPHRPPHLQYYPHVAVCLAEGLLCFEAKLFSDRAFWQTAPDRPDTLFRLEPSVAPSDCDIILLDSEILLLRPELNIEKIRAECRHSLIVLIEHRDQARHSIIGRQLDTIRNVDLILKAHDYEGRSKNPVVVPWSFGLSNRQISASIGQGQFSERSRVLRVSYRHTKFSHSVRLHVERTILPRLKPVLPSEEKVTEASPLPYHRLMWEQTGRRHSPAYFDDLKKVVACASFGGWYVAPWLEEEATSYFIARKIITRFRLTSSRISQWDSWRFWESMVCGAVALHADMDQYRFRLPVMPTNKRHYLGINLGNRKEAISLIMEGLAEFGDISAAGRAWVLEHYSPKPTAKRFLALLGVYGLSETPEFDARHYQLDTTVPQ